ncbi:hypothetical protein PRIPAC_74876 [Pristionchus pacificus]|uniref:Esterase n=1 Tax=Pristionchus pacificus TaxID=54126 RepID=A0A2A6BZL9_PRIPA|nr:hypothetical protein PRIPAC_74876 [Pristionchus pacificus]|eukprot:PDM71452.1 esterase [Pristionchus pacificus]
MCSLVCLLLLPKALSLITYPIVHTSYGTVRGYEYQAMNGFVGEIYKNIPNSSHILRKIPYASPPIGRRLTALHALRFHHTGRAMSQAPPRIASHSTFTRQESVGSGNTVFPDDKLVTNYPKQGVIMVTVSYRLGVLGVMTLGDENALPANLALHGDHNGPVNWSYNRAGSRFLSSQSPLFSRAIAMSAAMNLEREAKQVNKSHVVAAKLGCYGTAQEIIDCMRLLSTDEIINAASAVGGSDMFSVSHLSGITLAGELLPFHSVRELRENQKKHMALFSSPTKLLLGTMLTEFNAGPLRGLVNNINTGINQVTDVLGVINKEECVQKYYNDVDSGMFDPGYDTLSQTLFVTTLLFASSQAQTGAEVYLYQFDYPAHAWHADDVYYALGSQSHPVDENEEWLGRVYPVHFTNFIRSLPPAPDWELFDSELMNYYSINKSFSDGVSPGMRYGYHQDLTDYYDALVQFDENLTGFKQTVLNAPIQYKKTALYSSKPINIRDLFLIGIVAGIVLIAMSSSNLIMYFLILLLGLPSLTHSCLRMREPQPGIPFVCPPFDDYTDCNDDYQDLCMPATRSTTEVTCGTKPYTFFAVIGVMAILGSEPYSVACVKKPV